MELVLQQEGHVAAAVGRSDRRGARSSRLEEEEPGTVLLVRVFFFRPLFLSWVGKLPAAAAANHRQPSPTGGEFTRRHHNALG